MKKIRVFAFVGMVLANLSLAHPAFALKVGVTAGPHAEIMAEVKKELQKKSIPLEIVEFNDFILPNAALEKGDLDLNSYQHQPYLDDQVKTRGYHLVSVGKTIVLPLGVYSSKHKTIAVESVPAGVRITIPNDPTNGARALLLLQKAQLIRLSTQQLPTVLDIIENKRKIKIIEVEAPQGPLALKTNDKGIDYVVTNTDWILTAGIDPATALLKEGQDSPYANIIVVKAGNENRPDVQALVTAYRSPAIRKFIEMKYRGAVIPAWPSIPKN